MFDKQELDDLKAKKNEEKILSSLSAMTKAIEASGKAELEAIAKSIDDLKGAIDQIQIDPSITVEAKSDFSEALIQSVDQLTKIIDSKETSSGSDEVLKTSLDSLIRETLNYNSKVVKGIEKTNEMFVTINDNLNKLNEYLASARNAKWEFKVYYDSTDADRKISNVEASRTQ